MARPISFRIIKYLSRYYLAEWLRYRFCMLFDRPYFGLIHGATQGNPIKHFFMDRLLAQELASNKREKPFQLLEIGSWAGGSAVTFARTLKRCAMQGKVFCVDQWMPYFDLTTHKGSTYDMMENALSRNIIFKLFLHNIETSGFQKTIHPLRGASDEILPILKQESFDFVFIDGLHSYSQILRDINNSMHLVRDGGVLCGDDLDFQLHEVNLEFTESVKELDYASDPQNGKSYHPGVALAVGETLGKVSCWHGFWAMRKKGSEWVPVVLDYDEKDISAPDHLI